MKMIFETYIKHTCLLLCLALDFLRYEYRGKLLLENSFKQCQYFSFAGIGDISYFIQLRSTFKNWRLRSKCPLHYTIFVMLTEEESTIWCGPYFIKFTYWHCSSKHATEIIICTKTLQKNWIPKISYTCLEWYIVLLVTDRRARCYKSILNE